VTRMRPRTVLLVAVALVITLVVPGTVAPLPSATYADGDRPLPLPTSIAALGDSITRGYNACGRFEDCPEQSWSTGTDEEVNSQYRRLLAVSPAVEGHATNLAKSGAKVNDLARQAHGAVDAGANYVTILIGANDACTSSEESMTPTDEFRRQLDDGLRVLAENLPKARVLVVSIPYLAQFVWYVGSICQSMLSNTRSTEPADVARRERVRQRVVDYNAQLAQACSAYGPRCRFDDNAVFDHPFTAAEVSTWDAFHPDSAGQALIAEITSAAGFSW
jgi:lysophospholipase L1-like esterase